MRSPVAQWADDHGVAVLQPARPGEPAFLEELRRLDPECVPVVAYGALVPRPALDVPRYGWVNLHFSLLPAWRGAAPVQRALMAGDDVTGATTFLLEEGLDTGPVFGVLTERVRPDDTAGALLERLSVAGARLLVATLDGIADATVRPQPQVEEGVSLAPKVSVEQARVEWALPAWAVDRPDPCLHPGAGSLDDAARGAGEARPGAAGARRVRRRRARRGARAGCDRHRPRGGAGRYRRGCGAAG